MLKKDSDDLKRLDIDDYKKQPKLPVVVVLDNIRSLNNVGSLFRTADAFGMSKIYLCGISATPPNAEIHKTALGAELSVEWSYYSNTLDTALELKAAGYMLIAVEQTFGSVALNQFEIVDGKPYALIVGNEVNGVQQSVVDICDAAVEIPQCGTKHSLNVSVAAAIAMWHFFQKSID